MTYALDTNTVIHLLNHDKSVIVKREVRLSMTQSVVSIKSLPDVLFRLISTEKVRVLETDGLFSLYPSKQRAA